VPVQVTSAALTRTTGSWLLEGFKIGMQVSLTGQAEMRTITALTATKMSFAEGGLAPVLLMTLTVAGDDLTQPGGVRVGGDHFVVRAGGGPDSPLVIYGDTSQDGVWYGGRTHHTLGANFGPAPFDPFPQRAPGAQEDASFIFPRANLYRHAGNDLIDARLLFSGVEPDSLPSVGITAYGGIGDDTIIGSQTGDHLAGGSGNDNILGQGGNDHIYGDSGVNVDISTRALFITTVDASPAPSLDLGAHITGTFSAPAPSQMRDRLQAGRDVLEGEGAGAALGKENTTRDIIFGDHGIVEQKVADPNLPDPMPQKIQTTALDSFGTFLSTAKLNGANDTIRGNDGDDWLVGGPGFDLIEGGGQADEIFPDDTPPLLAARAPDQPVRVPALDAGRAASLLDAARAIWAMSGQVSAAQLAATLPVSILVADLPDLMLGNTQGSVIALDADAAGHGWFIDATPLRAEEFAPGTLLAKAGSAAAGRMDLLSVVVHELGHVMGFADNAPGQAAMAATLDVGRRLTVDGAAAIIEPALSLPGGSARLFADGLGAFLDPAWAAHLRQPFATGLGTTPVSKPAALPSAGAIDWSRNWTGGGAPLGR
jgi:Ca2+-binding RTX toxin-like protein